jgi:hypothetical protein
MFDMILPSRANQFLELPLLFRISKTRYRNRQYLTRLKIKLEKASITSQITKAGQVI